MKPRERKRSSSRTMPKISPRPKKRASKPLGKRTRFARGGDLGSPSSPPRQEIPLNSIRRTLRHEGPFLNNNDEGEDQESKVGWAWLCCPEYRFCCFLFICYCTVALEARALPGG